jgi:hypothetical protein
MICNDFIHSEYIKDLSLCDDIINFHKNSDKKCQGVMLGPNGAPTIMKEIKESTDVRLNDDAELFFRYISLNLKPVLKSYVDKFPWCAAFSKFGMKNSTTIQHYKPSEAYHAWHTERFTSQEPAASRHLVFMTYLNDVDDGGETEFFHQQLKVVPRKGLTLIWPADWTYVHRGIPSPTQEKYIVTGWYNFVE